MGKRNFIAGIVFSIIFILLGLILIIMTLPPIDKINATQVTVTKTEDCTCARSKGRGERSGKCAFYQFEHDGVVYQKKETGCTCGVGEPYVGEIYTILYNRMYPTQNKHAKLYQLWVILIFPLIGILFLVATIHKYGKDE